MMLALIVAVVAASGAVCRYVVDQIVQHRHDGFFPWGTFSINVSGALLLGLFTGLAAHHGLSASGLAILGSGFCAGFTTFSTWMWETIALAEDGALSDACLTLFGGMAAGLVAAGVGFWLATL